MVVRTTAHSHRRTHSLSLLVERSSYDSQVVEDKSNSYVFATPQEVSRRAASMALCAFCALNVTESPTHLKTLVMQSKNHKREIERERGIVS
jgi:hypothetical protein